MNHELVMLRGIAYCQHAVRQLNDEILNKALKSFSTEKSCGGTLGQVMHVAELVAERDKYTLFLQFIGQALKEMPRGYRALIVAVYIKNINKQEICKKYGVSASTVYRKLAKARGALRSKLDEFGCTEEWFEKYYGETEWVRNLLDRKHNGSRIAE